MSELKTPKTEEEKTEIAKSYLEKRGWVVARSKSATEESMNKYAPLHLVTKPTLTTEEAAFYLNRKPQTLRGWSMDSTSSPIKPISIAGRNAWRTEDVRRLMCSS